MDIDPAMDCLTQRKHVKHSGLGSGQMRLSRKDIYVVTTMLTTVVVLPAFGQTFPTGVFLIVDPSNTKDTDAVANNPQLFGPTRTTNCPGNNTYATCGGIIGIFLKVKWQDFQKHSTSSGGTTTILNDPTTNVAQFLSALHTLEDNTIGVGTLKLEVGLEAGKYASYEALDIYTQSSTGTTTAPYVAPYANSCAFGSFGINGGTFSTSGFPTQCVLKSHTNCIAQPRIWSSDPGSVAANTLYRTAYASAVAALAAEIETGMTAHRIDVLKIGGINDVDMEVGIPGNPNDPQPQSNGAYCGLYGTTNAADAEQIWTSQTDVYESTVVTSTWRAIIANLKTIPSTGAAHAPAVANFGVDVYNDSEFPPVSPSQCGTSITGSYTPCTYTPANGSAVPSLTTGEMEYLIENTINTGTRLIDPSHLAVQNQDLNPTSDPAAAPGIPTNDLAIEPHYYTNEIPCILQAFHGNPIGYQTLAQSSSESITSMSSNTLYLNALANAATYGAQYIEVVGQELQDFISMSNYGLAADNSAALSTSLGTIATALAANAASHSGALCPVSGGNTFTNLGGM